MRRCRKGWGWWCWAVLAVGLTGCGLRSDTAGSPGRGPANARSLKAFEDMTGTYKVVPSPDGKGTEALVSFDNPKRVTDAGLAILRDVGPIQNLYLAGSPITDAGLAHLKGIGPLRTLYLGQTLITDKGLASLGGQSQLQILYLNDTKVTDAGLVHLEGLKALKRLNVEHTKVTAKGAAALKKVLPGVKIER